MSKQKLQKFNPFLSVMIIIGTLLGVAFCKMEVRRTGYALLKMSRIEKSVADERRKNNLIVASLTRPDRIEKMAQNQLLLAKASHQQIVQVAGNIVLKGE